MYVLQTKLNNGKFTFLKEITVLGIPLFTNELSEALLFDNYQAAINKLSMVAFSFEVMEVEDYEK